MQASSILSRTITISLITSWLPPFKTHLPSPQPIYCKLSIFNIKIWLTYHMRSIIDMERFSHLFWAKLMSYHFSFLKKFPPLYIFIIYGVFFLLKLYITLIPKELTCLLFILSPKTFLNKWDNKWSPKRAHTSYCQRTHTYLNVHPSHLKHLFTNEMINEVSKWFTYFLPLFSPRMVP
jgi:hypothetical protein